MAKCCNDNLSKIFCNAYNKYYNTLYTNGEISKKETENLLVISYIRKLFINPRYINYRPILIKALRCIADRSCLLDSSELYGRLDIKTVGDKFVTVQMRDIYSVKIEETDPTVPQYVKDIKQSDITNWNSKLSQETDPIFSASPAATITQEEINQWNNPQASGALVVTVTLDGTYSADKTFTEMLTAWNSGQDVIVYYSDAVYQVSWIDDGGAWFFRTDKTNSGPYVDYFAVDGTDDSWTKNTYNLQERLVSGTNIKTINSSPILGSGNIDLLTNTFCPIIEDTRSSAVADITGVAPFSTLVDGQRIIVHLNNATAATTTINLTLSDNTTTGAIPLYSSRNGQVLQVGSNYGLAGAYIYAIYSFTNNRWNALPLQDANTTYAALPQSRIDEGTATGNYTISAKIFHDNAYIVEETYSSGSLKANKMYDFGEVTTALTIPSLDATNDLVSNALNFYALRFIAGADNLNITFPTGVIVDDTPTINTGDYVEIMINLYVENNTNHFYASIKVWQAQ